MPANCVREERATREAYGLEGNEQELPPNIGGWIKLADGQPARLNLFDYEARDWEVME